MKTKIFVNIIILSILFALEFMILSRFVIDGTEDTAIVPEIQEENITEKGLEDIQISDIDPVQVQEQQLDEKIQSYIEKFTLEEKIAQLFIVLPEALMTDVNVVTAAGSMTKEAIDQIPVGGFIYMSSNLQSEEQVSKMLLNTQQYSMERIGLPMFLCVDEEGGTVSRISGTDKFDVPEIEDMSVIGASGNAEKAYVTGQILGTYLSQMGFNVDFAPVADVLSNPENTVVKRRSFGEDPHLVTEMTSALAEGLHSKGIYSSYKHFPGHGATSGDTHEGYSYTEKTLDELMECELIPFKSAAEQKMPMIMVGHISVPNVTGNNCPASLSEIMIHEVLREQLHYNGVVITDAMNMGAIVQQYSSSEAAVQAIKAGADIILMPQDFQEAYNGVIDAVRVNDLSMERIDESLKRILKLKLLIIDGN